MSDPPKSPKPNLDDDALYAEQVDAYVEKARAFDDLRFIEHGLRNARIMHAANLEVEQALLHLPPDASFRDVRLAEVRAQAKAADIVRHDLNTRLVDATRVVREATYRYDQACAARAGSVRVDPPAPPPKPVAPRFKVGQRVIARNGERGTVIERSKGWAGDTTNPLVLLESGHRMLMIDEDLRKDPS